MSKIIITKWNNFIVTLLNDGKDVISADFNETDNVDAVGRIYIGKVKEVVKNIDAAFVEYQSGEKGYFSLKDNPCPVFLNKKNSSKVCQGDEIIVQIAKARMKTKDPVLSSKLEFAGKYAVLTVYNNRISFSGKFNDEEKKKELRELLEAYKNDEYGFIIRTNANGVSTKEVLAEIDHLVVQYNDVMKNAHYRTCHSLLYEREKPYIEFIRDLHRNDVEEIVTDVKEFYDEIRNTFDNLNIKMYDDSSYSLGKLYSVEKCIDDILSERIWLKSGAYLIIEPTEALTVVDVNTGKCIKGKGTDEVFYKVNVEAAKEIARQLRLRNISGIIIIDFINMTDESKTNMLIDEVKKFVLNDPVKTTVVDMTALGLMEITRKKIKPPVHELIKKVTK